MAWLDLRFLAQLGLSLVTHVCPPPVEYGTTQTIQQTKPTHIYQVPGSWKKLRFVRDVNNFFKVYFVVQSLSSLKLIEVVAVDSPGHSYLSGVSYELSYTVIKYRVIYYPFLLIFGCWKGT